MAKADLFSRHARTYWIQTVRQRYMIMVNIRRKIAELSAKAILKAGQQNAQAFILEQMRLAEEARLAALEAERQRRLSLQKVAWEAELARREAARLNAIAEAERREREYLEEMRRRKARSDELRAMMDARKAEETAKRVAEAAYVARMKLEADRMEIGRLMTAKGIEDRKVLVEKANRMRKAFGKI